MDTARRAFISALQRSIAALAFGALAGCGAQAPLTPLPPDGLILAFGDSLTYGSGAPPEASYPAQLAGRIHRPVVRAGVPGETTAEGLARLPAVLAEHRPRLVLLCLGGNDMLRGVPHATIESNLERMVTTIRASGAEVLLIGVPEPRVFGGVPDFFPRLADAPGVAYEGTVLNAVLRDNDLKSDPIHPNAAGYHRIAEELAVALREAGAL